MERQARGVHSSRSVSTFASVALVPAHNDQPRRDAATVPTGGGSKVIRMQLVGIVRLALVERRHVDLLRCASALCPA
jgi:hypothetical protein